VAVSAYVIAGCATFATEPLYDLAVSTDRSSYAVGDSVHFEVRNDTEHDAFFFQCGGRTSFAVERREGDGWAEAYRWGPICITIYETGVAVLVPGSRFFDAVAPDQAGTYRIRYDTGPRSRAIGTVRLHSPPFVVAASVD
jgi:hypothetical protein